MALKRLVTITAGPIERANGLMIPYLCGAVTDYPIELTIGNAQIAMNVSRAAPVTSFAPIVDADLADMAITWVADRSPNARTLEGLTWRTGLNSLNWSNSNGSLWVRMISSYPSETLRVRVERLGQLDDVIYPEANWLNRQSFTGFSRGGFRYVQVPGRSRNINPVGLSYMNVFLEKGGERLPDYTLAQIAGATEIEVVQRGTMAFGNGDELPAPSTYPARAGQLAWLTAAGLPLVTYDIAEYTADASHGALVFQYTVENGAVAAGAAGNFSAPHYVGLSYFLQPPTVDLAGLSAHRVWADILETGSGLAIFENEDTETEFAGGVEAQAEMTIRYDPRVRFISSVVDDLGRNWNVNATRLSADRRFLIADLVRLATFA